MLQDLFNDEGGGGDYNYSTPSTSTSKSVDKPPSPRNETNLCGLQNQGGTCYLNALIQTLLFTTEFREPLFRLTARDLNLQLNSTDSSQQSSSGSAPKVRKIIVELQRLFAEMLLLNQQACSSIRLTDSFGWQSNETFDHQDVHELNRLLFDAIQKSLQGTSQSNLIRTCYEGSTINYTQCKKCLNIFKRCEDYQDLPMVVQDSPNLHTSLANIFTIHEQLIGDNQYRCSSCSNELCDAEKWAKISKLPPILTLPLQRFVYDVKTGNRLKKTTRYEFPFEIDLKEFCEDSVTETIYELFAVVIHRGTCYTGHYYGYIKDIDRIGTWVETSPPPPSATKSNNKQKSTPNRANRNAATNETVENEEESMKKLDLVKTLLLGYDGWMTIDDLLKTYRENTSMSWNRTRGGHGTFAKFLRNHPEVFEVDDKRVRLVEQNNQMDVDENEIIEMEYESSQSEFPQKLASDNEEHWFCFDDLSVSPVTRQHIEKHYGQNECAYMLFYRKKNRNRTAMDCGDQNLYSIPSWLLEEIDEKNKVLNERREVYEKFQNQLPITIYPGEWFGVVDECRLNFNNNDQVLFPDNYGENILDKRMKANDLLARLECSHGTGNHYYIAKKLRSGQLHVISELNMTDVDTVLEKTDLLVHRNLIIFKYPSSLPDTVLRGEEFEPIMLNIVYGFPDASKHVSRLKTIHHVSKNMTLGELKEILCRDYYQHENLQAFRQVRMGKLNLEEKNNRKSRREYKTDEERQTLNQLRLQDGDTLGIDERNSVIPNWKSASSNSNQLAQNQLSLTVKNGIETQNTKPMTYSCLNTTLIEKVKLTAIQAFGLTLDPSSCRLYIDDDLESSHVPLHDHLPIDSIEFKQNNTTLLLKIGQALKENEILLYIISDREPNQLELVVNEKISLSQLWYMIKEELRMSENDDDYHLCEIKPALINDGPPLNDFDQSLVVNGLTNGAQLALKAGSVAPKNHVRLKIFRIIRKSYHPPEAIHTRPKFELVELEQLFEMALISPFNTLREKIAHFIGFTVPSSFSRDTKPSEFIRLYMMENNEPITIIHEPIMTTLKQEKVVDLESFAFELLPNPESLGKRDLLLNVVYSKDEDTGFFQHQFEVHWPLKENIVAKFEYLEQHVLNQLTSFVTNVLRYKNFSKQALKITMACYLADRAEWKIIQPPSMSNSSQSNSKKNRGSNSAANSAKNNLKNDPYRLKDGSVVAVLEGENLTIQHFDTKFDQEKRQMNDFDKEQKRLNRERNRAENDRNQQNGSCGRRRSPQTAMRIAVDDFDTE